jgi:gamma-glutamylaminecyclotransferase
MVQKVFVFGTLKRGFPLHDQGLSGAKFLGGYKTRKRYPSSLPDRGSRR